MTAVQRASLTYIQRRVSTGRFTPRTGRDNRYILLRFAECMGDRTIKQIGRVDIERWQGSLRNLAPGTRRLHFMVVRGFFDDLVERGTIGRSPVRPLPAPKVPRSPARSLNRTQVAALFAHAPDPLARCTLALLFQCALRRGEVAGIEVGDINWEARPLPEVFVTGKGGHSRRVPLPSEAQEAITEWLASRPGGGGALLRQRQNPHLGVTPEWVGDEFSKIAYAAGVKQRPRDGVGSHSGRHTAATDVLQRSRDTQAVQQMLGHQSLATTDRYCKGMDNSRIAEAMEGRTYGGKVA